MNCKEATLSLGVYLVGALDPSDRAEVDAHLRDCAECRAELADLAMLPEMLDKLSIDDLGDVVAAPVVSEGLFARVAAQARVESEAGDGTGGADVHELRRRPRWHAIAAAAAVVVVIGGASATAVEVLHHQSSHTTQWEDFAAARGLVHMRVGISTQATGTALRVTVSGLPTEEHCRLVAVADDGTTDLVGQWDATYAGEAQVTGSTSIASDHLSKLVLYGTHGGTLVTVPV